MRDCFVFNSATPNAPGAENACDDNHSDLFLDGQALNWPVNLLDKLDAPAMWAPRNQDRRGTCNAFAALSAEELYRMLHDELDSADYSEEYLYALTRKVDYSVVPGGVSDDKRTLFEETGGTFLAQVKEVLTASGLALEEELPYDPDAAPNHVAGDLSGVDAKAAKTRAVAADGILHDIAVLDGTRHLNWHGMLKDYAPSSLFAALLQRDIPVVASFAILKDCTYVWTGNLARGVGQVRYPPAQVADVRPYAAGHSVCLVGYVPNHVEEMALPDEPNPGWFLFRNSFGTQQFGQHANEYPENPNYRHPGYGFISAQDVDRFCWEFMARAHADVLDELKCS